LFIADNQEKILKKISKLKWILFTAVLLSGGWHSPAQGYFYADASQTAQAIQEHSPGYGRQNELELAWIAHLYQGNDHEAVRLASRVLAQDENNYSAHELMATICRMQGDYAGLFRHSLAMLRQNRIENALYLPGLIYMQNFKDVAWTSLEQMQQLETVVLSQIGDAHTAPWLKYYFRQLLSALYLETGQLDKMHAQQNQAGYVRDWLVIGPFENQEKLGFDESYAPEREIDLSRSYLGMRGKVAWKKMEHMRSDGAVDFNGVLYPREWTAAYALTYVYVPGEKAAALRMGSDDSLKVWLNDELVISDETYKGPSPEQQVRGVRLAQGWNKILVKVCQGTGTWEFYLRLTDPEGAPLADLKYSLDPRVYARPASRRPSEPVTAMSVEHYYQDRLANNPRDESSLYYLARNYKNEDQREEAVRAYEKLLQLNGRCASYWLEAGEVDLWADRPTQGLAALLKATELDPAYLEAHVRLAEYYAEKKLYKKSEAEVEQAKKINADQVEGLLVAGQAHAAQQRWEAAYQLGQAAVKAMPSLGWAHNELGYWAQQRGFQSEALAEFQESRRLQQGRSWSYINLADLYKSQGQYALAIQTYQDLMEIRELDLNLCLQRVDVYRQWKKQPEAIQACQDILDISPDFPGALSQLGLIAHEQGRNQEAKTYLTHALQAQPDNMWLREYEKKLFPQQDKIFEQYRLSQAEIDKCLQARVQAEDYPKCSAAYLLTQKITHIFGDGSSSEMQYIAIKILTDAGRDQYGSVQLPNDDSVKILKAHTLKASGEIIEPTDIQKGKIVFSNVEPGDTLEYQYTDDRYFGAWLKGYYQNQMFFQTDAPILKDEWDIALPQEQELHIENREGISHRKQVRDGEQIHSFRCENLKPLNAEPHAPAWQDISAAVFVSTIPSWDFMAKWANNLLHDQLELDAALKEKLAQVTRGLKAGPEQIRAVYNFVAKNIRYTRRDDSWIFYVKPQKAANVFADGFGVCKDKALLLVALLKALGVPAYMALVETNDHGHLLKTLPFSWFNHAIVYLPQDQGPGLFLDPTGNYTSFGDMWQFTQENDAFVCTENGYEFIRTPHLAAPVKRDLEEITILADGQAQLESSVEVSGYLAAFNREDFRSVGKRKEVMEKRVSQELSGAKVTKCELENWDNLDLPLRIEYSLNAPAYARLAGKKMSFTLFGRYGFCNRYAEKSERQYDLVLDFYADDSDVQTFTLPAAYQVAALPEPATLDTPWFKYKADWSQAGDRVICRHSLTMKTDRIKQAEYARFRVACIQMDSSDKQEVILSLKP
jgi:tetratricopeptide (TPR) repeat protein